jgi:hypothetical protein
MMEEAMKKMVAIAFAWLSLMAAIDAAWAACPAGTRYVCSQSMGGSGKVICRCE